MSLMSTASEIRYVQEEVANLLDAKEDEYGDAWKGCGLEVCLNEVFRKANYLKVRWERGRITTPKFREDMLDLLGWGSFVVYHIDHLQTKEDKCE